MNSKERLEEYIRKDNSYREYKEGKEGNDFDRYCVGHCQDIETILEENKRLKEAITKGKKFINWCMNESNGYTISRRQSKLLEEMLDEV